MREPLIERIRRALLWDDPDAMDRVIGLLAACLLFVLLVIGIQERLS